MLLLSVACLCTHSTWDGYLGNLDLLGLLSEYEQIDGLILFYAQYDPVWE